MLSFFFPDRVGAPASRADEAEAPRLVSGMPGRRPGAPAILHHSGGGLPLFCAGGGALGLGLVLGGGGGGFCSGAPPGCELGALAGGFACSLDGGGALGDVSLDGGFAEPPPLPEVPLPPHAAAESESAATHRNNKLRFIRITSHGSRQTEA